MRDLASRAAWHRRSVPRAGRASGVPFDRADAIGRLAAGPFDVLVIGGGITGAGVALDAASRGLRTALVEKGDFASGTSSKSSKLVHGGLRYLQQRELRLVYENLAERQRLLDNAPHLVSPLPFLIPLFGRDGLAAKAVVRSYSTVLWLYDVTGGVRIGRRHRRVDRAEALSHLPLLRPDRLVAGFLYYDARADDARLTLTVLRTAALDHGAVVANYARATELLTDEASGRVVGAKVTLGRPEGGSADPGSVIEVSARVVVNAGGVWTDEVRTLEEGRHPRSLRPAKGVHVTVPVARMPCDIAAVLPVSGDHRSVFVVPWPEADLVYVGTTDTAYDGPLDDPACTPEDVDYLLGAVNASTTAGLTPEDVTGVWAGLRPLLAPRADGRRVSERTADLSRRHAVSVSARGLVTVTGGKLTTYRKMAADAVDAAVTELPAASAGRSVTRRLPLRGAPLPGVVAPPSNEAVARHLWTRYGTEGAAVAALADGRPELLEPAVGGLPYLGVEVLYAVRCEMACTLEDVLERRTRAGIEDARAAAAAAPAVAALMASELGWSPAETSRRAAVFADHALAELDAAGVPSGTSDRARASRP